MKNISAFSYFLNTVLVVEDGDIVECGKYEELIATKGKYHELFTYQTRM